MTVPLQPVAPRVLLIRRLAERLGFAQLGIAPAQRTAYAHEVHAWLAAGAQGEMKFMVEHLQERLDPTVLLPGAVSIICVADMYPDTPHPDETMDAAIPSTTPNQSASPSEPTGRFARYAWGDDYHRILKKRLHALADMLREQFPQHQFLTTVDSAPILEREHATRAGMGWIGKNTMLIHPALGSWMLLGEIVTTLPLQSAIELGNAPMGDHCGTCTRCIDACPTQCITPRRVDAQHCVSYLTIEHRDVIPAELHEGMGDWIAGCDICQEVCPFNHAVPGGAAVPAPGNGHGRERGQDHSPSNANAIPNAAAAADYHPGYATRPPGPTTPLIDMLNWTAADRQKAFERSALKRIKLDQLKRNALIAAGNALAAKTDDVLLNRVRELAEDENEPPLVRVTARQVLERLGVYRLRDK